MQALEEKLRLARDLSWARHGKRIAFYLPGMFSCNGHKGLYPAVSVTGSDCALKCDHCQGKILESMMEARTPGVLKEVCLRLAEKGSLGILITGGCDKAGRLPWDGFLDAIAEIKAKTGLYLSVHCGLLDDRAAVRLKQAGIDQALLDVIGDDETYRRIYHVDFGIERIVSTLESLERACLPVVPHIVCGLDRRGMIGEKKAVEIISRFQVKQVVIVSRMPLAGTSTQHWPMPGTEEIAGILMEARFRMPGAEVNLGCARQRGNSRLEVLGVDAGVNRMALPSPEAVSRAREWGLEIRYQRTCCSVSAEYFGDDW